eukprot:m.183801 g.183801  ORF g.183801 m.183801 type:complete len:1127 (-) comp16896_c0_seq1:176-3556(-)
MLHATAGGAKAMTLEFKDIPAKFIGTKAITAGDDDERAAVAEFLVERSRKKEDRQGMAKDLLLTLSTQDGLLRAYPKSGGQALSIALPQISSIAVIGTKFAFVVGDESSGQIKGGTAYAFQFRKKGDAPGFLNALEKASIVDASRGDVNTPRGRKVSFSSTTMSSTEKLRTMNRPSLIGSSYSGQQSTDRLESRLRVAEVTISDLQRRLTDERNKASGSEVARLTLELEKTRAQQEAAEAHGQVENLRKEMALAAADMSAELAQLKMDLTHEAGAQILSELGRIAQGLATMDSLHKPDTPLWERVGETPTGDKDGSSTQMTSLKGSKADVRLMAIAQRASNAAIAVDGVTGESAIDDFYQMEKGELIATIEKQQAKLGELEAELSTKTAVIEQLQGTDDRMAQLQVKVEELQQELAQERQQAELEKSLMADTIAALKQQEGNKTPERLPSSALVTPTVSGSPLQQVTRARSKDAPLVLEAMEAEEKHATAAEAQLEQPTEAVAEAEASAPAAVSDEVEAATTPEAPVANAEQGETLQEFEVALTKNGQRLGISIAGGNDDRVQPDDARIYITAVLDGGVAIEDGRLNTGDIILAVDGHDVRDVPHSTAVERLSQSEDPVVLTIGRYEELDTTLHITFPKGPQGLGFSIAGGRDSPVEDGDFGIYITAVIEGGSADSDGRLRVGDRLLSVNDQSVVAIDHNDAVAMLQAITDTCDLVVARPAGDLMLDDEDFEDERMVHVDLPRGEAGFGFSIAGGMDDPITDGDDGIYVTQLVEGGLAMADGRLQPGDRLVQINGVDLAGKNRSDAVAALKSTDKVANIIVARAMGEEEELEIEFSKGSGGLGFSIAGGVDDTDNPDDTGIYVIQVIEGGSAHRDGRLRKGDKLLTVNGENVESVTHERAVELLQSNPNSVHLTISRLADETLATQDFQDNVLEVAFEKSKEFGLGFSIAGGTDDMIEPGDPGIYISDIIMEGPAGHDGRLQFGDELLEVNGQSLHGLSHAEAVDVLRGCDGVTVFKIARLPANDDNNEVVFDVELNGQGKGLGFSIAGGIDDPVEDGDTGVYITNVLAGGVAHQDGRLALADQIIAVNGVPLEGKGHDDTVKLLQAEPIVKLTVSRLPDELVGSK